MNFITGIRATSSGLAAEQARLDIVSQNIANAYTTKDIDGAPYKRRIVAFESVLDGGVLGVRVSAVKRDSSRGELVFNPGHPHADRDGIVHMPNVKLSNEMVDLVSASRAYEANLSVARNARSLAMKALSIGK